MPVILVLPNHSNPKHLPRVLIFFALGACLRFEPVTGSSFLPYCAASIASSSALSIFRVVRPTVQSAGLNFAL